jgi:hypothetical protein
MGPDETARTLSLLAEHRSGGEYVLHSARMVGDEEDHAIWRQSRRAWRTAAASAVSTRFPSEGTAFRQVCRAPTELDGWRRQYEAELRTVRAGLDLLGALAETTEMQSGRPEAED